MRRLLPLLGLLGIVLLTGCSDLAGLLQTETQAEPVLTYVAPTPEPFPAQVATAARIRERGAIIVGIRYDLEPFSFISANGELAGLEIDLAHELAQRWLGNPEAVIFRQLRSDTAAQHLIEGDVDIVLAGVPHTRNNEQEIDFSPPYFINGDALLTFPDTGIRALGDVNGRTIGVVSWTNAGQRLKSAAPVTPTLTVYDNFFQVTEALRTRQIEAYADERHRLERARRLISGAEIVGQYSQVPFALGFRENDPFFANLVTLTFQDMTADGTCEALFARWMPGTPPPTLPRLPGNAPTPSIGDAPQERATADLSAAIKTRGTLRIGYLIDLWPYSANRDDGVPTGFEVRLLERVAEVWFGSREAVEMVPVTRESGLQALLNGEVDVLAGGWIQSRELELQADTSLVLFDDGVSLFSLSAAPYRTLQELVGRPVGVVANSDGAAAIPQLTQLAGGPLNALSYPTRDEAVAALQRGEVVAVLAERGLVLSPLYRQAGFTLADARLTYRPVSYVLPQGDSNFRDWFNETLMQLHDNGVFREVYTTWFDDPAPAAPLWPR
ncbi:MAG TPA: transporter substrate-binding domain-containing protein [Anaerolineae bacterium]|nr:transporter substrate-binding domain-containing protein [Anaerolineae bacterium]HXK44270.1 transporter substrate-binding domain-containing protein [Anaerolineae bacterium]